MMTIIYLIFLTTVSSYRFLSEKMRQYSVPDDIVHKYTASITYIPHHVLIVHGNMYCSGALVRSKIVITSASCLMMKRPRTAVVVKVGADNIAGRGQIIPIIEIKIHEYFQHLSYLDNDIAMLVLKYNVIFGPNVKKVIIVDPEVALRTGTSVAVSGWGGTNVQTKYVNMLLWSEMVVIDRATCEKYYNNLLTPSNFCVKYQPDRRLSDNGGPAMFNHLLVGILSFGASNINDHNVALVTNVSYFHRWIAINSMQFLKKYCISRDSENYDNYSDDRYEYGDIA